MMHWCLVVVLFLLTGLLTNRCQGDSELWQQLENLEVQQQYLKLDSLLEDLKRLDDRFENIPMPSDPMIEYSLNARITVLEGSGCGEGKVQCGRTSSVAQCVSDFFVCDGVQDCANGRDEDPHICSDYPVRKGNSFVGKSFWNSCFLRPVHQTIVIISGSRRSAVFKSRVWVRAVVMHDVSTYVDRYEVAGYFNFARRQLVLLPLRENSDDLAMQCVFNRGDHFHVECKLVYAGTFNQCGFLKMVRM